MRPAALENTVIRRLPLMLMTNGADESMSGTVPGVKKQTGFQSFVEFGLRRPHEVLRVESRHGN
jgi:hypothetical protein